MAREIDTLDSSKEHLLKEGESEKGEALICPALPCRTLPIVPSCCREACGGKAGRCEASSVFPVWG